MELAVAHVPGQEVKALKAAGDQRASVCWSGRVPTALPACTPPAAPPLDVLTSAAGNPAVTTGDAVQALAGLLQHTASGAPLLPIAPKAGAHSGPHPGRLPGQRIASAARLAARRLRVACTRRLGGRAAGACWSHSRRHRRVPGPAGDRARGDGGCGEPGGGAGAHHALLPGSAAPQPPPTHTQPLDLGLGALPAFEHELTLPRARGMAVIRAAPRGDGLLVQLCLPPRAAAACAAAACWRRWRPARAGWAATAACDEEEMGQPEGD